MNIILKLRLFLRRLFRIASPVACQSPPTPPPSPPPAETPRPPRPSKTIAQDYFHQHPEMRDEVLHAWFAFHASPSDHPGAHDFSNLHRLSLCVWCGRSREQVRYDDASPHCLKRPPEPAPEEFTPWITPAMAPQIADVLRKEEALFESTLAKARSIVPRVLKKRGDSPQTRKYLYETHGLDQETVEAAINPQ